MTSRCALLLVLVPLLLAGSAAAQAPADSLAAATDDSLAVAAADTAAAEPPRGGLSSLAKQTQASAPADTAAVADPFFSKCTNTPEAHVKADVTKVQYGGKLGNTVAVRGGGTITDNYGYTYDSYRRQNKTVENRTAQGGYSSGKLLPVVINMQGSVNWTDQRRRQHQHQPS